MKFLFLLYLLFFLPSVGHSQTLLELNKKFIELFQQGKYEEAIPYAEKAFAMAKKELSENHPDYITNLENLGWVYLTAGYYAKAVPAYTELAKIKGGLLGKDHPDYATIVNNLGILYYYMGDYSKAEAYYSEGLAIRKEALGENDPDYATSLDNLGALYAAINEFEKAESLYIQSMDIRKRVLGETDDDYISSLNNLASLYLSKGEYSKAEPMYLKAASARNKTNGENSVEYATSLNNLGALYLAIGQYDKAELLFITSIDIRERLLGDNHPSFLVSTNNLSQVYSATGQYEKAISLCIQTIAIRKKILGENHPDYATSLNNLGVLYSTIGEYAKGVPYCTEAAAIRKKILGNNHSDYAASMNNLGYIYKELKQYKMAETFFIQAKEIYKLSEGEQSPSFATSLNNLAVLYITMGEYTKAEPLAVLGSSITLRILLNTFSVLSEKEKGNYLFNKSAITEINNNLIYHYPKASASLRVNNFNLELTLKSLALSDTKNMITAIRNSKDTAVKRMFNDWLSAKSFLAKQYSMPATKRVADMHNVEARTEKIEKELSRLSVNFQNQQLAGSVLVKDVQKKLKEDEAMIEFLSFHLYSKKWTDSIVYAAYVLRKNEQQPLFIPLCEENQIEQLFDSAGTTATTMVNNFYRGIELGNTNSSQFLGTALYKLIWKPLEPYLIGINKISYSPAGKLFSISFQALPADSNIILMDKYEMRQYTSSRQVALREEQKQISKPTGIALFGNASFTMDSLQLVKQKELSKANTSSSIYTPNIRGENNYSWSQLPGTAEEVKKIKGLFDQKKITAKVFTQTVATEENLKALDGNSPQVLHIATHGFFLPQTDKKRQENNLNNVNTYTLADDPLMRSGLILAGGNYAWSGKPPINGVEDGIATAYEISQLNLSNTELVVLSACETALGDVKGSEGVFGLQRAFKMAGVKKMIVSLWQVPDKETAELMTTFYAYWMKGKAIEESFTQAQADMRKKYSPFYWAAFVLVE